MLDVLPLELKLQVTFNLKIQCHTCNKSLGPNDLSTCITYGNQKFVYCNLVCFNHT